MLTEQDYRNALVTRHHFWNALSPTVVRQRIDQLLFSPDCEALVQALSPVEYIVLLKEAPEMRPQLLQLAQPQQIRLVLDLDCWHKDTLQGTRLMEWLEELQRSGVEVFAQVLRELDLEMLIVFLRQYIRVHGALPPEEEDEPKHYDEVLANELYRIEFVEPENALNARVYSLLKFMRLADLDLYYHLMQGAMWEQDNELQEQAYRWKSGRLQDEGFADYYETLETYLMVDLERVVPAPTTLLSSPGIPESVAGSGLVPSYAWSLTPPGSLLAQALANDFSAETLERICWEMVYLCNGAFVYDQVDFGTAAAVRTSLQRVHARLNIGIGYLSGGHTQQLAHLLTKYALQFIYQVGFTLVMRLHQRANRIHLHLTRTTGVRRALPGMAHYVLAGLLHRHPQFFEGLAEPAEMGYRDFLSVQDTALVDPILQQLETDPTYRLHQSDA